MCAYPRRSDFSGDTFTTNSINITNHHKIIHKNIIEVLRNLFEGYPNLWGGGVAHSVLILSLTIASGIILAKIKIKGISLGVTWILFVGIVFGHFNMNLDEHLLHFLKEFGLILFVYSIGLQVGPGFFSAFKKGGFTLNMLAVLVVALGVGITIILHFTTGTPITTMVGILSGSVTNTPGLGAAQQANSDLNGVDAPDIALGYAVSYPLGVVGIILSLIALKYLLRINMSSEEKEAETGLGHLQELTVRPVSIEIRNEAVNGTSIKDLRPLVNRKFVISRIRHREGGETELVKSDTVLHIGDIILVISTPIDIEAITVFFGKRNPVERFNLLYGKNAMQATDRVNNTQCVQDKILIVLHISHADFHHKVIITGCIITFGDFFYRRYRFHELASIFAAMLLQANIAKHHKTITQFLRIKHYCIFLDVSFAFQTVVSEAGQCYHRTSLPKSAMRFCINGRRKHSDGRGTMEKSGSGA